MKRHKLLEPVIRDGKEIEFARYVVIHKQQVGPTKRELFDLLKDEFYASHTSVEKSKLDKIWEFIGPKIENNAGMAEFTKDNQGHKSDYFFPWLINVFRSPATALEMSYGAGSDLNGDWTEGILNTNDPLVPFIKDDPAFVYNRERQLYVADLANSVQDLIKSQGRKAKIVDFGAGRLAWIRKHGYVLSAEQASIYAFDRDPSIKPEELFSSNLEDLGIYFKHGNFAAQFKNPDCQNADLIIMAGLASYIKAADFVGKIIPAIYRLLNPDGIFFFDLQLDCPCYRHSMDILDWPEFKLPSNIGDAIHDVEKSRRMLWEKGIKFSAEYQPDTYNTIPSGVMVTMQKIT